MATKTMAVAVGESAGAADPLRCEVADADIHYAHPVTYPATCPMVVVPFRAGATP